MNKKIMLISLMSLAVIFLIGTVCAAEPTYNDQSAPCYACNSTECHCNNTCLCKDPNYENITKGDTRIRNDNGCYYCNESCDCPDNCSCKHPPVEETSQQHNSFWDWLLSLFSKITNYNRSHTNTCTTDTNTTNPSVGPSSDNPSVSANPSVEPEQNDTEITDDQEQYDDNNPSDVQEEESSSDTSDSQSPEYDESE